MIEDLRKMYYEAIKALTVEDDIKSALPLPEYESFFHIMYGLIEFLKKDLFEVQLELDEITPKSEEWQEYLQEEKAITLKKLDLCLSLLEQAQLEKKVEQDFEMVSHKNLIFATTSMGNVYLEKDLKDMPQEYYDDVHLSLKKLQEGFQEKNPEKGKGLKNNAKMSGLHEIKEFKVRIFYKILSPDCIYVIQAKMKKSDNDLKDREEAIVRNKATSQEFKTLKTSVKKEEEKEQLINQNKQIADRIFGKLNKSRRG